VDELLPLSPERLAIAGERLRHPAPGSRIAAARDYGIDLTLLIENLRLTPEERIDKLQSAMDAFEEIRGAARLR
jgi:hypothetical protein